MRIVRNLIERGRGGGDERRGGERGDRDEGRRIEGERDRGRKGST